MLRTVLVAALAAVLALAPVPADAAGRGHGPRWSTVSAASTQEACGLVVTATYRRTASAVILDSVLAAGLRGWRAALTVTDSNGRLVYAGPNAHGEVGDGVDYLWTGGTEVNGAGLRVPIGASDDQPKGWPRAGYRSAGGFVLRVSAPEWRYCGVELAVR